MAPAFLRFSTSASSSNNESSRAEKEELPIEEVRARNMQLEQQLKESQRHENELRAQLEEMRIRLSTVEEAEERLCSQLGDLEAEAVEQAQSYSREINSLKQRLTEMENLLAVARPCSN
eukprot:Gb_25232 [translate_table: standard]